MIDSSGAISNPAVYKTLLRSGAAGRMSSRSLIQKAAERAAARKGGESAAGSVGRSAKEKLGSLFNRSQKHRYPFNELYLENGKILDSYDDVAGEIVSRKFSQLWKVDPKTAIGYLNEVARKYKPDTRIADVPSSTQMGINTAGKRLRGQMIL